MGCAKSLPLFKSALSKTDFFAETSYDGNSILEDSYVHVWHFGGLAHQGKKLHPVPNLGQELDKFILGVTLVSSELPGSCILKHGRKQPSVTLLSFFF